MNASIVGMERVNYTKKDGTDVDSHIIHISRNDMNVVGQCTEQVYLTAQQLKNLKCPIYEDDYEGYLGLDVAVDYNSRGRICNFSIEAQ